MLIVNDLTFKRNSRVIFRNFNLSLPNQKLIRIKGKNGSGKTTLIKIISNILIPDEGDIFWNGKKISKKPENFYKDLTLILDINTSKNDMKVIENINYWKKFYSSKVTFDDMDELLKMLEIYKYKNNYVKNLSYGEKRKLELCKLIIQQKKLWLIDEPYLGLDDHISNIIDKTFKSHCEKGGMIIFSSHYNPKIDGIEEINLENYANN